MSKTEERIKEILREYYEEKQSQLNIEINNSTMSIYIWGVLTGVTLASSGIWSLFAGMTLGYIISKNTGLLMDNLNNWTNKNIILGYNRLTNISSEIQT